MEQRYWQAWTLSAKTTIITEVWRGVTRTLQGKALTRCFVGRSSLRWRETSATVLKMRGAQSRRKEVYVRCGRASLAFVESVTISEMTKFLSI